MMNVQIPMDVWGKLAAVAEMRGVMVADLLVDAIGLSLTPRSRAEQIVLLAQRGWTDKQIAAETGETTAHVARVRRKWGIEANKGRALPGPSLLRETA